MTDENQPDANSGKMIGLGLLVILVSGLIMDPAAMERATGFGVWPIIGFTLFVVWAVWFLIMVDRGND